MAKRINVKLILELSAGGLTQNEIAVSQHFSTTLVPVTVRKALKSLAPSPWCLQFGHIDKPWCQSPPWETEDKL